MSARSLTTAALSGVRAYAAVLFAGAFGACAPAAHAPVLAAKTSAPVHAASAPSACHLSAASPDVATRRLTVREYGNTLVDLFSTNAALRALPESLAMNLAQLPRDGQAGDGFAEMDARMSQRHLETYLEVADKIATHITSHDAQLTALAGACALAVPLDLACFQRFLTTFGAHAWRRPLTVDESDRFLRLADGQAPRAAYELTIAELLSAPEFLFHLERGVDTASTVSGARPLSAYELASRLSYHFWQSMPDERLFQAAASGALESAAGYRAEVVRLASQQRARATWYRFFREWLKLDDFGGFAQDRAFSNFAGGLKPTPELYQDAVWEIEQLAGYYTFDTPGSYRDLMTSNAVITRSPRLAKLYDVEPWDGRSLPAVFRAGERGGLLTRAALMISASHSTNPFRRGAFVQRQLLCEPLERPVNLAPGTLTIPPFDPLASTRTRYEHKVGADECQFCHARFSPYGYVLEAYDALGRHRHEERLLDDEGEYRGKVAIDEHATVLVDQNERQVSGPIELGQILGDSKQATDCFARQYFRFTFRRQEREGDACTLRDLEATLASSGLLGLYREIAFTEAFRSRVPAPSFDSTLGDAR